MKTITFYSYKGGVGRSLALSKIAIRLSQLKKKVCILDFDLDAPGLGFKFSNEYNISEKNLKGLVDYINLFSAHRELPKKVSEYASELVPKNINSVPIIFISAGDFNSSEYWKKLAMIRWADMFYSKDGQGVKFFLDFKAKIEKEFMPDYLLIDSRTGITDISGITLRILADEIVILAVDNKENIFGTKKILESIANQSIISKKKLNVRVVLTRMPYPESPQEKEKEFQIIQNIKKELLDNSKDDNLDISIIHTDKLLEENESTHLGISQSEKALINFNKTQFETDTNLSNDYINLFNKITKGDIFLSSEVLDITKAENEFIKAINQKDPTKKITHLNNAINLDKKNYRYLNERGRFFWDLEMFNEAINDFKTALSIVPNDIYSQYALGLLHIRVKEYEIANEYLSRIVFTIPEASSFKAFALYKLGRLKEALGFLNEILDKFPDLDSALNSRADCLRVLGKSEEAMNDIYRAIELNPNEVLYLATLAEIRAASGDIEGFYLSLTFALSKGLKAEQMTSAKDIYGKFVHEKRFLELMSKYQINIDIIINSES
jgi:tetratricopeptide (TPR) repeat protein